MNYNLDNQLGDDKQKHPKMSVSRLRKVKVSGFIGFRWN